MNMKLTVTVPICRDQIWRIAKIKHIAGRYSGRINDSPRKAANASRHTYRYCAASLMIDRSTSCPYRTRNARSKTTDMDSGPMKHMLNKWDGWNW